MCTTRSTRTCLALLMICLVVPSIAEAIVEPAPTGVRVKQFRHPDLHVSNLYRLPAQLALDVATVGDLEGQLQVLGIAPDRGFWDQRAGTWGTLLFSRPLIPGSGANNALAWSDLGAVAPASETELRDRAWTELRRFIEQHRRELGVDPAELSVRRITVHDQGRIIQIHAQRIIRGVAVRDASLTAVINSGNLILYGTRNWAVVGTSTRPRISSEAAKRVVQSHVAPFAVRTFHRSDQLVLVPLSAGPDPTAVSPGRGIRFRLAWALRPELGDRGNWEALVAADDGELLAFADTNQYATRNVVGGVYPLSNDGVPPDGVELPGLPMPFADIEAAGDSLVTDSGGNLVCVDDSITTTLAGPFIRMNDTCGSINESSAAGDLDLEFGPGTDCVVPAGHSAGDTHASRSGFYELNRQKELARGYLPDNEWLQQQLTANMNIDDTCNANWNGSEINFFKSGGGCANTGEIAAVFDHEWGHGMDANDANPGISSPGESVADVYGFLRLWDPCFGRGFIPGSTDCNGGYGDPCVSCSGVRGSDWALRESGLPHDIDWILSPTDDPPIIDTIPGGCVGVIGIQQGPCGQETHCEGYVPAEAIWDLAFRDLQGFEGSAFDLDASTAVELATRLTFQGAGNLTTWYQCGGLGIGGDGCNADGGYLNYLAADDDNGDLDDGTPHMSAIFAAFDRHQIACDTPAVLDSGCAGSPDTAPVVTGTPLNHGALLEWDSVPDATRYAVFRTDGVHQCDFGKIKVGETTDTSFVDAGLKNDYDYFYTVAAIGASDACTGPMSACTSITPEPGGDMQVDDASVVLTLQSGDGDDVLDNCERAVVTFDVVNSGDVTLTNVRIVAIEPISHPTIPIHTALPAPVAASLPDCAVAQGSFEISGRDLAFNDTVEFRVDLTSVELSPLVVSQTLTLRNAESDFAPVASRTYSFENGFQGWEVASGTFTRQMPGADGTLFHLASSALVDNSCDQVRSPLIRLTGTSTLSLFNMFSIEPMSDAYYDRANLGVLEDATGERTTIIPDGGLRPYNVPDGAPNGVCVLANHAGWNGPGPGFLDASWSSGALNPGAAFTGEVVQLDVAYGTDPMVALSGFQFDEVTLTDFEELVPDAQSDTCPFNCPGSLAFADGFESGDTSAWDRTLNPDGDLTVTPAAALDGAQGMQVTVNDPQRNVVISRDLGGPESTYCFSFLFDPNSIVIPAGRQFIMFGVGGNRLLQIGLILRFTAADGYQVKLITRLDNGTATGTDFVSIPDAPVQLAGRWAKSDGSNNGALGLYLDGALMDAITGLDNDEAELNVAGIGQLFGFDSGTSGVIYFDLFEHRR